ncbi:acyltransferase [Streptomyces gobitricini]|uniref:acyltransferase family protein n=1 Tax=Streptomyces gobitricini TaxID=68211 RepID=UPI0031DB4599
MTGLRCAAALAVFVCHAAILVAQDRGGPIPRAQVFAVVLGPVGVSFFFVLSGFVLTHSARATETAGRFWSRRGFRIYPAHLAVWGLCMVLFHGAGVPRVTAAGPAGDLAGALLVHTLIPVGRIPAGGNSVTWSLTCELVFSLCFPFLLPVVLRLRHRHLRYAAAGAVLVTWAVPLAAISLPGAPVGLQFPGLDMTEPQVYLVYLFPLSRLAEFVLGMVLARMHARKPAAGPGVTLSGTLVLATAAAALEWLPAPFLLAAATTVPNALLVRAAAAADVRREGYCLLRSRVVVLLGDLSYAFYLLHYPALMAVRHVAGPSCPVFALVGVALGASLIGSWLLHTRVERPTMRWFARRTASARGDGPPHPLTGTPSSPSPG